MAKTPPQETSKTAEGTQPEPQAQERREVKVDDAGILASYSNFCRVTGTPEELIIDFGLNPQPVGPPPDAIVVSQRIILNFYTAKRMLAALQMTLQRHEAAFGVIETNIQKRVVPQARA